MAIEHKNSLAQVIRLGAALGGNVDLAKALEPYTATTKTKKKAK